MMPDYKQDYIFYRKAKSEESFVAAQLMAQNNLLTSAVNRCYYACFYAVDALLFFHDIPAKTHSGAKSQFNLHFIKTAKLPIELGELFSELADLRQESDYSTRFEISETDLQFLILSTRKFIDSIIELIP
jgi:uncharacterized protein (UPF0332 family)